MLRNARVRVWYVCPSWERNFCQGFGLKEISRKVLQYMRREHLYFPYKRGAVQLPLDR